MKWTTANILLADVKGYSSLTDEQMKVFTTDVLKDVGTALSNRSIKDKNTWGDGIVIIAESIAVIGGPLRSVPSRIMAFEPQKDIEMAAKRHKARPAQACGI